MTEMYQKRGSQYPGQIRGNPIRIRAGDYHGILIIPRLRVSEFYDVESHLGQGTAECLGGAGFPAAVQDLNLSDIRDKDRLGFFAMARNCQSSQALGEAKKSEVPQSGNRKKCGWVRQLRVAAPNRRRRKGRSPICLPGILAVENFQVQRKIIARFIFQTEARQNHGSPRSRRGK